MQKYKEINGNDYVKNSRTTINETMQSIQSMNSGTAFPTNNLFEGMKCYRTDLKKTYTLTDVENNTWVEDAHATLSDKAMHAASATKLQTARSLNLGGAVTAEAATFDGTADATINVKTLDATKLKGTASVSTTGNAATASKLETPRTLSLTGNATGSASFDGSGDISINTDVNYAGQAKKLADESGSNYLKIDTTEDKWSVIGPNVGIWLKSIRTERDAPPYSIGNYSAAIAFGGVDTKGIITHAFNDPIVKFAGGNGSTAIWKFSIKGGSNNETYDLNSFPTKTGKGASGTWDISITGNADTASKLATARNIALTGNATGSATFDGSGNISISTNVNTATNADKLDGYHASDLLKKITSANTGGIVAASLTENGYAKFANGLILQWGNASGYDENEKDNYSTFPIAFSSTCFVVLLTSRKYMVTNRLYNQSKTGFTWTSRSGLISWAALGM